MEKLKQKCTSCGVAYEGDFYELRKYFTTNKKGRNGLDPRCKKCKREISKKYRVSRSGDEAYQEKYKENNNRRLAFAKYGNSRVENMATEDISVAIEVLENRLKELKREMKRRQG